MLHIRDGFPEQRQIVLDENKLSTCKKIPFVESMLISHIGHFPKTNYHFVERPEGAPEHIFILNLSGEGWIRIDERLWTIHPNSIAIIPANTPHAYGADESVPWNIYWMHLRGPQADSFLEWKQSYISEPVLILASVERMIELFETAIRYSIADFDEIALAQRVALANQILAEIFHVREKNEHRAKKVEGRIIRSIRFMQESLNRDLALEELAREATLSVPHYCALFKAHTGTTPLRFFTRLRLQRACELMENESLNVKMVSEEMGFADPFYFGRVFKKIMGITPASYRKLLTEKADKAKCQKTIEAAALAER